MAMAALQTEEAQPQRDEIPWLESAHEFRRAVSAERVLMYSRHGFERGRDVWTGAMLKQLIALTDPLPGQTLEAHTEDWTRLATAQPDPVSFLEEAVIAVRIDERHQVISHD